MKDRAGGLRYLLALQHPEWSWLLVAYIAELECEAYDRHLDAVLTSLERA